MTFKNFLLSALLVSSCVSSALADVTGSILGNVRDSTSAAVIGAHVVATNTATGAKAQTISSSTGNYVVPNLPVGPYEVKRWDLGFQSVVALRNQCQQ